MQRVGAWRGCARRTTAARAPRQSAAFARPLGGLPRGQGRQLTRRRHGVLAAIEQAAAAQFDRENTTTFGRDTLRRYAVEDALAAHFQLPTFVAWQAAEGPG